MANSFLPNKNAMMTIAWTIGILAAALRIPATRDLITGEGESGGLSGFLASLNPFD